MKITRLRPRTVQIHISRNIHLDLLRHTHSPQGAWLIRGIWLRLWGRVLSYENALRAEDLRQAQGVTLAFWRKKPTPPEYLGG